MISIEFLDFQYEKGAQSSSAWSLVGHERTFAHGLYFVEGENMSGKSTFLDLIAGQNLKGKLQERILIDDQPAELSARRDLVLHLSNDDKMFPELSIWENIAIANPDLRGKLATNIPEIVKEYFSGENILSNIDMNDPLLSLSSGGQVIVKLLRSVATSKQIVIFDEVTTFLDDDRLNLAVSIIEDVLRKGALVFFVSHAKKEKELLCKRLNDFPISRLLIKRDAEHSIIEQPEPLSSISL